MFLGVPKILKSKNSKNMELTQTMSSLLSLILTLGSLKSTLPKFNKELITNPNINIRPSFNLLKCTLEIICKCLLQLVLMIFLILEYTLLI